MIRILQVVNAADRGGAETLAMNIYRIIDRNQIQFDFTNHNGTPAAYDSEIKSLGGRILYLPKFKGYNYFHYTKAWRRLFREHPEYEIIHIHNYNIAGIVANVARKMGVKVIITHAHSTQLNMSVIRKIAFYFLHHSMMKNTTHFFSCGRKAATFLFGRMSHYTLIPNAIDVASFKFNKEARCKIRNSFGIEENVTVYGHVGTFRTPKNHDFLINIFVEIIKRQPNSKLIMVGSGELLPSIRDKVERLNLSDKIIFAGQQLNVSEWLSAFDVFVMPSLWEGFPVSVVEAQCAGLPCAISDCIDHDTDLTGKVKFISLDSLPMEWANIILSIPMTNRIEMASIVEESPFNIWNMVSRLSNFYIKALL